jgi:sorting nexin-13
VGAAPADWLESPFAASEGGVGPAAPRCASTPPQVWGLPQLGDSGCGAAGAGAATGGGPAEQRVPACPSAPLYALVDAVFRLRDRGWLRRQAAAIARQLLSLLAGGAIDAALLRALSSATSAATLARGLDALRASLWPGGVLYSRATAAAAAAGATAAAAAARAAREDREGGGRANSPPPLGRPDAPRLAGLTAAGYLARPPAPDDAVNAEEVRRRLAALPVPGPLVALLGRGAWLAALHELHDLAETPTATLAVGHALLEAAARALFPELRLGAAARRGGTAQQQAGQPKAGARSVSQTEAAATGL